MELLTQCGPRFAHASNINDLTGNMAKQFESSGTGIGWFLASTFWVVAVLGSDCAVGVVLLKRRFNLL